MDSKQEAKELVGKFYRIEIGLLEYPNKICEYKAIKFALICVDEKIKSISKFTDWDVEIETRTTANKDIIKLEKIKQEIFKL